MKNIKIILLISFTVSLFLYARFFSYQHGILWIPAENREIFVGILSLISFFAFIGIYNEIIQRKTQEGFKKKLYFFGPFYSAIALGIFFNGVYIIFNEKFFDPWSGGRSYHFEQDFLPIYLVFGLLGCIYSLVRVFLQHIFLGFFQKIHTYISDWANKRGKYITIICVSLIILTLTLITVDHSSYGKIFHLSNDPSFSYYWEEKALQENNIALCELLENDEKDCYEEWYDGKIQKSVCGRKNMCIDQFGKNL